MGGEEPETSPRAKVKSLTDDLDSATGPGYVVGVGASAGGLEALELFFGALPGGLDAAYVVVQHLSPDFKSHMPELLGRRTHLPVEKVEDGVLLRSNVVYLLPPKKEMVVSDGRLLLADKKEGLSHPIDVFFRSLAQDMGPRAVGIVLSGTGSDGSRGIRDIHDAGGLVIAQSLDSAAFDGMPMAAHETGVVDLVLEPTRIPGALERHFTHSVTDGRREQGGTKELGDELTPLFALLRNEHGVDFNQYKKATIGRRIQRRAQLNGLSTREYRWMLETDATERQALTRDFLIGVTEFFRDTEIFEQLEQDVIPELVASKGPGRPIRAWVAGCATGEEAYSIAMLFRENLQTSGDELRFKLFATDVHQEALQTASAGVYSEEALRGLSPQRRERHFIHRNGRFQVHEDLRKMVVFTPHDLLRNAPFTQIDLVSCRNLLIYLKAEAQKKVLSHFHFGLRTDGVLVLGKSESPGVLGDEFVPLRDARQVYRKRRDVRLPFNLRSTMVDGMSATHPVASSSKDRANPNLSKLLPLYDRLLERSGAKGLLVDDRLQLLHYFGGAENMLKFRAGRFGKDIRSFLEPSFEHIVTGACQRALKERRSVTFEGLVSELEGKIFRLVVDPVASSTSDPPSLLVYFESMLGEEEDDGAKARESAGQPASSRHQGALKLEADGLARDRIQNLEGELHETQENLQSTIEELETSNEELQSANEELVTSNEELQSTNEELHSVNEELYTVNTEHQLKIVELTRLTEDMDNLLATTEVGVMFLDDQLTIRKFTPRIAEIFRLQPQDVGRRVDTFAHTLHDGQLEADLKNVLATTARCEREVTDEAGNRYLLRILPYRSKHDAGGVVLTLIDIEAVKLAEDQLRRLSDVVASSEDAIIGKDLDGIITSWNRGATKIYGFTEEEAVGQHISMLFPNDRKDDARQILERIKRGEVLEGLEVERVRKNGEPVRLRLTISPVRDPHGAIVGASAVGHDITGRRRAEEALAESEQRLRLALDAGHMGTFELELGQQRMWVDENFALLCALPREPRELDLSAWLDRVHPDDRSAILHALRGAVDGGGDYRTEFRVVLSDGRQRWLASRGAVVRGDGERDPRMLGVTFDITGTKRAERRLSAIHAVTSALAGANAWADAVPEILRALSKHLPADVCELWMNDGHASERMVCVHTHSTLGADTPQAYTNLANGATFERGEGLPGRVLSSGKPVWLAGATGTAPTSGAPPFATALGFPITTRDNVDAVITCFSKERQLEDPALLEMLASLGSQLGEFYRWTESENARRRADERLRETLDTLVPFVGLCKPDGTLIEANRSLLEAADIDPSEVLGRPFHESSWFTWSPGVQEQLRGAIARAAEGEPSRFDVDIRIGENAFVTLDFKIVPMADESGNVTDLVASGVDVTGRKAAEQTLRDLNNELERRVVERTEKLERRTALLQHLSRQLARVEQDERKRLARILHDHLQQLIAAAKIRIDLLEDHLNDETSLEHLTNARDSLEEAVGASRNLAAELSPPILETAALPETLKWLVRRVYETHRMTVSVEEEEIPPLAYDTKVFLFQAARELIFNVVKHAKVDRCSLRVTRGEEGDIRLTLSDDGVGFDPAAVVAAESTGLGLLSLRERLEGLGGRMVVESRPNGGGTSIELIAPALENDESAEVERPSVPARRGAARAGIRRPAQPDGQVRVLIVDDHRIVREGLASILSAQPGIEVAGEAQDGEDAVDLTLAIEPDVVLMDVDLPGVNGIEATRRIKSHAPRVRIIGLSIHEEREVAESMLNAGASDFLTKGGHPERLFRRILDGPGGQNGEPGHT